MSDIYTFPRNYEATVASRQTETEAESQARHAGNNQGLYIVDVFRRILKYHLNFILHQSGTAARRQTGTEAESQARHARYSRGLYCLYVFALNFNIS